MWRNSLRLFQKVSIFKETCRSKVFYSTKSVILKPNLAVISFGVGALLGVGYGGYKLYKINAAISNPTKTQKYPLLETAPNFKVHYKIVNNTDTSKLQLVFFQYRTCPFCCKVRSYLDARGISYDVVEVDAILRQDIKWSEYKKVPILLVKVDGGYQTLFDSSAIISVLETYLKDKTYELSEILRCYPIMNYVDESGKNISDITNKYFLMENSAINDKKIQTAQAEERKWRQWADSVLVHTLSPNVYRTGGEALETFKWFEDVGGWRKMFPAWECALMVYMGAAAMWIISKRLKARHHIKDDVRQSLYDAANTWMETIENRNTPFLGGAQPNLADISVFGILSSIEGCQAFKDLNANTNIGTWFENMKTSLESSRGKMHIMAA